MNKKQKYTIYISGAVAVITLLAIIIKRKSNKKIISEIQTIIDTGKNEIGSGYDLGQNEALNETSYKGVPADKLWAWETVSKKASLLKDELGTNIIPRSVDFVPIDEENVYNIIRTIPTKAKMSQVSEAYLKLYKVKLWDVLQRIDDSVFGLSWMSERWLPKIESYINSLPKQ